MVKKAEKKAKKGIDLADMWSGRKTNPIIQSMRRNAGAMKLLAKNENPIIESGIRNRKLMELLAKM